MEDKMDKLFDRLQMLEDRYEELGELLSDPDVIADTQRFTKLSKELADLRETVEKYNQYKKVTQQIKDDEDIRERTAADGVNGYYGSFTAQLQKDFNFGLSLMAAYTFSESMTVSEGIGDQVSSSYSTMTYSKNGSNTPELGHSAFVSPHRFIASISYRIPQGNKGATTLGLFYEGYN